MDVFVTGASGYIGTAVVQTLVARGHRVRGLARSDAAEVKVKVSGGIPVRGSLASLDVLQAEAARARAVVHTAADSGGERPLIERHAVEAMLSGMVDGVFVGTSGAPRTRSSRHPVAENETAPRGGPLDWLHDAEGRIVEVSHVRGCVFRVPMAYGDGGGPIASMVEKARAERVARYIEDGHQRWSTVHVRDLARAYAMALEGDDWDGVVHVADEASTSLSELMSAVAEAAGVGVEGWTLAQARAAHGMLAGVIAEDHVLGTEKIRSRGWRPWVGDAVGGIVGSIRLDAID